MALEQDMKSIYEDYNHPFKWNARFAVDIVLGKVVATIRITTDASNNLFYEWSSEVASKWNQRFCLQYGWRLWPIEVKIVNVTNKSNVQAHYQVATKSGYTKNMTTWGDYENVAVAHEVGHMLGNKDEYFTIDNVTYSLSETNPRNRTEPLAKKRGESLMNNPKSAALPEHYYLVMKAAEEELSLPDGSTVLVPYENEFAMRMLEEREGRLLKRVEVVKEKLRKHGTKFGTVLSIYGDQILDQLKREKEEKEQEVISGQAPKMLEAYKKLLQRFEGLFDRYSQGADELIEEENNGLFASFTGIMAEKYPQIANNDGLRG